MTQNDNASGMLSITYSFTATITILTYLTLLDPPVPFETTGSTSLGQPQVSLPRPWLTIYLSTATIITQG